MANDSPVAASRFGISIDGVQIASFLELQGIAIGGAAQPIRAHELAHVVQQGAGLQTLTLRFSAPTNGSTVSMKLRSLANQRAKLTAYGDRNRTLSAFVGTATAVGNSSTQQAWTLTYASIQRVS